MLPAALSFQTQSRLFKVSSSGVMHRLFQTHRKTHSTKKASSSTHTEQELLLSLPLVPQLNTFKDSVLKSVSVCIMKQILHRFYMVLKDSVFLSSASVSHSELKQPVWAFSFLLDTLTNFRWGQGNRENSFPSLNFWLLFYFWKSICVIKWQGSAQERLLSRMSVWLRVK